MSPLLIHCLTAALAASLSCVALAAQPPGVSPVSGYNQPPKEILDVMQAPSPATPLVSPTLDTILLVTRQDYP